MIKIMKIYELENQNREKRYFTSTAKLARLIGSTQGYVMQVVAKGQKTIKQYRISQVEDPDMMIKASDINPETWETR